MEFQVLNLIINGLPSIPLNKAGLADTLNDLVLNLIINGLPSILSLNLKKETPKNGYMVVLNLIINGLPSIPMLGWTNGIKDLKEF